MKVNLLKRRGRGWYYVWSYYWPTGEGNLYVDEDGVVRHGREEFIGFPAWIIAERIKAKGGRVEKHGLKYVEFHADKLLDEQERNADDDASKIGYTD